MSAAQEFTSALADIPLEEPVSGLRKALSQLDNPELTDEQFYRKFCDFVMHLTNADHCSIARAVGHDCSLLVGTISERHYAGMSVSECLSGLMKRGHRHDMIEDPHSQRTLRLAVIQAPLSDSQKEDQKEYYLITESLNETPFAAALAQERFEMCVHLLNKMTLVRGKPGKNRPTDIPDLFLQSVNRAKTYGAIVTALKERTGADIVFLCPVEHNAVKSKQIVSTDDNGQQVLTLVSIAMSEAIEDADTLYFHGALGQTTLAQRNLAKALGRQLAVAGWIDETGSGAIAITRNEAHSIDKGDLDAIAKGAALLRARALPARLSRLVHALPFLSKVPAKMRVPLIALVPLVLMVIPVPRSIKGEAFVVPVDQQVITAPFSGRLNAVMVEPGDYIVAGKTVIATMDVNDLLAERDALKAQYVSHLTEWKIERSNGNAAEARLAQLRAEEVEAQIDLAEHRISNSDLTSPVSGYVQGENQKRNAGIHISQGDEIYRVVQQSSNRVEFSFPAHLLSQYRDTPETLTLRLDAYPGKVVPVKIDKLYPIAEFSESRNLVRGVGSVEGQGAIAGNRQEQTIRAGMRATARIHAGWEPLMLRVIAEPVRKVRIFIGL